MRRKILLLLLGLTLGPCLRAQRTEANLSDKEVEELRDSAYVPAERVLVFVRFLDERGSAIEDLFSHPRQQGREQDTHDLLEQFTAIADELGDNLEDYGPHHRDLRRSLPKLMHATERWATQLKTPPDDARYSLARKLALEAVQDLHEETAQLIEEQRAWFAAHPPPKDNGVQSDATSR